MPNRRLPRTQAFSPGVFCRTFKVAVLPLLAYLMLPLHARQHARSTFVRCRLVAVLLVVTGATTTNTAADPVGIPFDLFPHQEYRLAFSTSQRHDARSDDISVYNDFIAGLANAQPALAALNAQWRVIGSTATIDARTNTGTNFMLETGVPIYRVDGITRIADNNADLWDGEIANPLNILEDGTGFIERYEVFPGGSVRTDIFTGTYDDGTGAFELGDGAVSTIGRIWPIDEPLTLWIALPGHLGQPTDFEDHGFELPFFGMSSVLTVPRPQPPAGTLGTTALIAAGGDTAADGNGKLHRIVGQAVVNDDSAVLFAAEYSLSNGDFERAAVLIDDGVATQLVRTGETAPDGNGVYDDLHGPVLGNDGTAALYATFSESAGGFAENQGVVIIKGSPAIAVRKGDSANGDGTFVSINNNLSPTLSLNDFGEVAVTTALTGNVGGFAANGTIVVGDGVGQDEIAREGDLTPAGNGNYGALDHPVINDGGTVAFRAFNFTNLSPPSVGGVAIVSQTNGIGTEIVRSDANSPDGNGKFDGISDVLALNNHGQIAFQSTLKNTVGGFFEDGVAMFRGEPGALHVIARAGDAAPDGNGEIDVNFPTFGAPRINDFGEVAFNTQYRGTQHGILDDNAIVKGNVIGAQSSLIEVVREGWSLPGDDGVFADVSQAIDMNAAGVVAFHATLRNLTAPSPGEQAGIFLGDGIDIVEVVRVGDVITGYKVEEGIRAFGFGITAGSLNAQGQVAFRVPIRKPGALTDGVFLFTPDLYWRGGTVGTWDEGLGALGQTNPDAYRNWTLGLIPDSVHKVLIDRSRAAPSGGATPFVKVTGPATDTTVGHLTLAEGTHLGLIGSHLAATDGVALNGGRLHGAGELSGDVTIAAGGALEADGLVVNGDVVNDGRIGVTPVLNDFGIFNGTITNNGATVIANTDLDPASATFNGNFINHGTLAVGVNQTAEFHGDYFGPGTIANDGNLLFHAGFFPGASPAHIEIAGAGTLTIADTATTVIELGGLVQGGFHGDPLAQYDSIELVDGGSLVLGGTLVVALISADDVAPLFAPTLGDSFMIFMAGQILGDFDGPYQLPDLADGLAWLVDRDTGHFALQVVTASPVPLPAGIWLLGTAIVVLAGRRACGAGARAMPGTAGTHSRLAVSLRAPRARSTALG